MTGHARQSGTARTATLSAALGIATAVCCLFGSLDPVAKFGFPFAFAFAFSPHTIDSRFHGSRVSVSVSASFEPVEPDAAAFATSNSNTTASVTMDPYIEIQYESYFDGTKPDSSWNLARTNFIKQGSSLGKQGLERLGVIPEEPSLPDCLGLKLSNEAVTKAEERRIAAGGGVNDVHPVSKVLYDTGCLILDKLFDDRPIQRFWFLETIARIPYFSYVSMLHLYESFGWFRAVELRKVHAAEDWNELHHLLIMESLGGNRQWSDRFLGYHVAFAYYWFLVVVYLGSPRVAYQFMELLEAHAVDTYSTFVAENRERLAELPPPAVASGYYRFGDLYLFDDFMTTRKPGSRRPPCDSLLDVFENIAVDEGEHVKTMKACQDYASFGTKVVSPHLRFRIGPDGTPVEVDNDNANHANDNAKAGLDTEEDVASRLEYKRKQWKDWSASVNVNANANTNANANANDPTNGEEDGLQQGMDDGGDEPSP